MRKLLIALATLVALWLVWEIARFPDVAALADEPPESTAFMERRMKELRAAGKNDSIDYRWVSYDRISPHLRQAVLVSEDSAFWDHKGVDVEGMKAALRKNWEQKKVSAGGSTITQQLAKNLYLSPSRNPLRKVRELVITWRMERTLSKKRILEIYLNVAEMGERVYGAEAAARHYFGKSARRLTPSEAALLAGALPNPRKMNPGDPNRRLRARQKIILSRMKRWGHLAETEMLTARKPKKEEESVEPPVSETTDPVVTETIETDPVEPTETEVPAEETAPAPDPLPVESAEPPPTATSGTP